jgi:hypothetical protein
MAHSGGSGSVCFIANDGSAHNKASAAPRFTHPAIGSARFFHRLSVGPAWLTV